MMTLDDTRARSKELLDEIERVIVGKRDVLELILRLADRAGCGGIVTVDARTGFDERSERRLLSRPRDTHR